jgi:hypothetical protein
MAEKLARWTAVTASVYQMMRGAEMLFAALFAVIFLRRRSVVDCGVSLSLQGVHL